MAGDCRDRHRSCDLCGVVLVDRTAAAVRGDADHHGLRDRLPGCVGTRDADGGHGEYRPGRNERHPVQERLGARRRHQAQRHRLRQDRYAHRRPAGGRGDRDGGRGHRGRGADRRRSRRAGVRPSAGPGHPAPGGEPHRRGTDRIRKPRRHGRARRDRWRNGVPRQPAADGYAKARARSRWRPKPPACRGTAAPWSMCLRPLA